MATEMAFVASALLTQQELLVEQQAVLQQLRLQQLATPKQQHDMVLVNVAGEMALQQEAYRQM